MNLLTFLNMHLNELQNAVIQNLATDPTTGNKKGRVIFNSSENVFKYWDGSQWVNPSGGGGQPTDTVTVPYGGTGATSFTLGNVLIGNGTSPVSTKAIDTEVTTDSTNLIASGAVKTFVDAAIAAAMGTIECMKFMGTVDATGIIHSSEDIGSAITTLTEYKKGWTFKASANIPLSVINIGGVPIESGDILICISDATVYSSSIFSVIQTNTDGTVTGPSSSTNSTLVAFDGTTGKIIKEVTDTEGNPVTLASIQAKFDTLFTIDSTGDVVVDGATQVIGNGDTTKLKLVDSGVTAGTYGENTDLTIVSGDTITVPKVTIDSKGRVTSAENQEVKINITGSVNRIDALNPTLTQSSGVCTWTVQHDLNCEYPVSSLYEVSTGEMVMADIKTTSANVLTITILSSTDIVAGTYHIAICG